MKKIFWNVASRTNVKYIKSEQTLSYVIAWVNYKISYFIQNLEFVYKILLSWNHNINLWLRMKV